MVIKIEPERLGLCYSASCLGSWIKKEGGREGGKEGREEGEEEGMSMEAGLRQLEAAWQPLPTALCWSQNY